MTTAHGGIPRSIRPRAQSQWMATATASLTLAPCDQQPPKEFPQSASKQPTDGQPKPATT